MVLAYVDARALQGRLDEVFSPFGWEDKYECIGDDFICTLTVSIDGKKTSKQNGATRTQVEGFKGGLSSAFKRVCASGYGIGRYLYDLDVVFAETSTVKKNSNDWNKAFVKDKEGKRVTYWWKIPTLPENAKPKIDSVKVKEITDLIESTGADEDALKTHLKINRLENMSENQYLLIKGRLEKRERKNNAS